MSLTLLVWEDTPSSQLSSLSSHNSAGLRTHFDQPSTYAAVWNLVTSYQFHRDPDPSNVSHPY